MALTRAQTLTFLTDLQADVLASLADATSRLSEGGDAGIVTHKGGVIADVLNWRSAQLPGINVFSESNQQDIAGTVAVSNIEALVTVSLIAGRGADSVAAASLRGLAMELFRWMNDQRGHDFGDRLNARLNKSATMSQMTISRFVELVDPASAPSHRNMFGCEVTFVVSQSVDPRT